MYLDLLGSAGKSKKQIKAEEEQAAREVKAAEERAKKERAAARAQRDREREIQKEAQLQAAKAAKKSAAAREGGAGGEGGGDAEDEDEADAVEQFTELPQLLAEPSVAELPEARRACLCEQDTLTALPHEGDDVLFALPVCAPYSVFANYAHKIKLTPGSGKKGKAAKQAVGLLASMAPSRERELMRALTDDELVRVMLANVKVQAPAKLLQQQKSAEKRERKEKATERGKKKEEA